MEQEMDISRRQALSTLAAGTAVSLSGCTSLFGDDNEDSPESNSVEIPGLEQFRGSGSLIEGRPAPGGTSIADLPDLSGSLNIYIGGGEGGIYQQFSQQLAEIYPEFSVSFTNAPSSSLAQTVVEEANAGQPQADLFWSIDASSLGFVSDNDAYEPLPDDVVDPVPSDFRGSDNAWVGVAGRARSIPYNTNQLSESDIPDSVMDIPDSDALLGSMGWAPTYGAFKSFVTAMRLTEGPDATREWLVALREGGTEKYPNEFAVSQEVADGTLTAGFANHYYALRVRNSQSDVPLGLAFTNNDPGALVDIAGILRIQGTEKADLAHTFIKHLLSSEAQEFITTISFAYPMIEDVAPPGDLPPISELNPPDIDLSELSNLEPTLDLMRDAGVLG